MTVATVPSAVEYGTVVRGYVHFDDLDPLAVMHNSRYAVILERALSSWFTTHGYTFADGRPTHPDMTAGVREFAITYHVPIRGTGPVDVHFWLDKLGTTSAVYGFRFLSTDHTTVYAEGRRVMVKMDFASGRTVPWTDAGRALVATLLRP